MTIRLSWITDIHLNFLTLPKVQAFCRNILAGEPDAVVLTGDISEAPLLDLHLLAMAEELKPVPLFFVCGNHDYYNGSIVSVREFLCERHTYPDYEKQPGNLYKGAWWLGNSGIIPLTETAALVGHDGWYDGLYANWFKSRVWLNDYDVVRELAHAGTRDLMYAKMQELAKEAAAYVRVQLEKAFLPVDQGGGGFSTVYVATHVPPFRENSVYRGKISDDDWMPHFSSWTMGDMLLNVMTANPDKNCVVLCGHSHGGAVHQALPNLVCKTGEAEYRAPRINEVFEIG